MSVEVQVGPDLITIHLDDEFAVCEPAATMSRDAGNGAFAADTRFVSGYRLTLGGVAPQLLNSAAVSSFGARFEFTNAAIDATDGAIPADTLHLRLDRSIGGGIHEDYDLVNYGPDPVETVLEVRVESDFADLFDVRAQRHLRRGTVQSHWDESACTLVTRYEHLDFARVLRIEVAAATSQPQFANGALAFPVRLEPGARWRTCLLLRPQLGPAAEPRQILRACHTISDGDAAADEARRAWVEQASRFSTPGAQVTEVVARAVDDLAGLRLHQHDAQAGEGMASVDHWVPAAGVPWYVALFGRDALIVSLQTLTLAPRFALGALHALGSLQGDTYDDERDLQPGKILHELRRGELAHLGLIPHTPYYGSHDATSLYVWTAAAAWRWHADRAALDRVRPHVERALAWIERDGDVDGDGLQEYATRAQAGGYRNQGWKDSSDGIVTEDGQPAEGPIALCELQGYVVAARRSWADVLESVYGERAAAVRLRDAADRLAALIEDRFWWDEEATYVLGLDGRKRPIRAVASNAGHLLWTGAIPAERARTVTGRLLADDMNTGWGVRTLSADHVAYNPFSYHRGSVWPHDNAIIAAGMRTYGFDVEATRIAGAIFDAARCFVQSRPPELWAGLPRDHDGFPVQYRGANVPQAWASGAIVHLLATLLGAEPDGPEHRLTLRPSLPTWLPGLTIENLQVGDATVDLRITRRPDGSHQLDTDVYRGHLDVRMLPSPTSRQA